MVWDSVVLALRLFWRRMGLFLGANILWLGLSLLIVPWPAATAGLFYLVQRVVTEELEAAPRYARLSDFWAGFRSFGLRGSVLALIDVLCLSLIVGAGRFYWESAVEPLRWLVGPITLIGLVWAGAQLYLYPLLIQRAGRTFWEVAREAGLIAISYPLYTFSLLLTALMLLSAAVLLAGPILLVFFSFLAMLQTLALRSILVQRGEIAASLTPEQRETQQRPSRR